ncbi:hypothetical protein [Falsiroseomonas selenitidurans]|uniref:Uncharacterized protein n=1 Tax=Falsiroseomonas selenitidurans TaxID=2716335 RepID=A0ABX1EA03_9PROT|nr:hypothetical protein [Falsiroseomonas selenitidurans]NKC33783.1 hypothetical protein [Falsiroseomonas selenitidurans]
MPVIPRHIPDAARVAELRAALQRDLERMLEWRGPVTEVRRLLAEIDQLTVALPGEPDHPRVQHLDAR